MEIPHAPPDLTCIACTLINIPHQSGMLTLGIVHSMGLAYVLGFGATDSSVFCYFDLECSWGFHSNPVDTICRWNCFHRGNAVPWVTSQAKFYSYYDKTVFLFFVFLNCNIGKGAILFDFSICSHLVYFLWFFFCQGRVNAVLMWARCRELHQGFTSTLYSCKVKIHFYNNYKADKIVKAWYLQVIIIWGLSLPFSLRNIEHFKNTISLNFH